MATKLHRITINLTDEQVGLLPEAPTKTERVMRGLYFELPKRGRRKGAKRQEKINVSISS